MTKLQRIDFFSATFKIFLNPCPVFLFKKTPETVEIFDSLTKDRVESGFEKIRCPLCNWKPKKANRWSCADCDAPEFFYGGCYQTWNTFETRGKCPNCAHQWRWTSCLKCHGWSLHEDWYEKKTA